jgi:hypothetical protein
MLGYNCNVCHLKRLIVYRTFCSSSHQIAKKCSISLESTAVYETIFSPNKTSCPSNVPHTCYVSGKSNCGFKLTRSLHPEQQNSPLAGFKHLSPQCSKCTDWHSHVLLPQLTIAVINTSPEYRQPKLPEKSDYPPKTVVKTWKHTFPAPGVNFHQPLVLRGIEHACGTFQWKIVSLKVHLFVSGIHI